MKSGIALIVLLNSVLIFVDATASYISENNAEYRIGYYLPDYIIPQHYDIELTLPTKNKYINNFSGKIRITINISVQTQTINLHVLKPYIETSECTLNRKDDEEERHIPISYIYYHTTNILTLRFKTVLLPNIYMLKMKFKGTYNEEGFLKSPYVDEERYETWSAATHFQLIHSRVFPCWDEPEITSTFSINVKHHPNITALSTMPIKNTILKKNNMKQTSFYTTDAVPSYLVGIVLADLKFLNYDNASKISNAWHGKQYSAEHIKFARMIAKDISLYIESKWKEYQKVLKVDHVVIPYLQNDSIQNLGLVTYRETDIIYNEGLTPIAQKIKVARIVSHKMAHQFLDSRITPAWWSDLWLNDGIATLLGIWAVNKILPDSRMFDLFLVQYRHESLHLDSYFMEPLISEVKILSKINSLATFSRYIKAPVILHMLQYVVSDSVFWKGFRTYLDNHQVYPATPDRFWESMQTALRDKSSSEDSIFDVKLMMDAWTKQIHYPVLNVKLENDGSRFTILLRNISDKSNWWIPVTFTTQRGPNFERSFNLYGKWLKNTPSSSYCEISLKKKELGWVIFNLRQTGYYRVNYEYSNWLRIAHNLNHEDGNTQIHALNRAQLIDDSFHFMMAGQLDSSVFWNIMTYLQQETDYIAWYPMLKIFEYISSILPLQHIKVQNIKKQIGHILDQVLMKIGYDEYPDENDLLKCLKQEAVKWACIVGVSQCKTSVKYKLEQHLEDPVTHKLLPWWKDWTYCKGMMAKSEDDINEETMLRMLQLAPDIKLFESLACYENPNVISTFLKYILIPAKMAYVQPITRVNTYLLTISKHARNKNLFQDIIANFNTLRPDEVSPAVAFINIINHVHSKDQLDQVDKILETRVNNDALIPYIEEKIKVRWSQITYQISYLMKF